MPMKNPTHPGEIIRDLYIEPLELTVTQAAAGLGVSRKTLSLLLNGHAGFRRRHLRLRAVQVWPSACPKPLVARPQGGWLQLRMHFATWPRSANGSKASR